MTLHDLFAAEVPISQQLGIRVESAGPTGVALTLPLGPNRNLHGTMFAGSVNAAATLAGWALVWLEVERFGLRGTVVVQDSRIEYRAPITEDCRVTALPPDETALVRLRLMLERRRRGRVDITVPVLIRGHVVAHYHGRYVVLL
jgi:thioesterase domain-containing protein